MTKQEAMERFSSGAVQQSLEIHRGIQWTGRIIGLVACALIVKYMPSDWAERVWYYLLLLVILWTLHRLGESQAFICENGLVLKRRPFSVKEYFHSLLYGDEYFVFVDYEHIIGFTEEWRELQAMNGHGGIYVIPLDLHQVAYKDKMAMIEAIHKHTQS